MNRLYRLYEASPEAAFAELDQDLAQLEKRLTAISETADPLTPSIRKRAKVRLPTNDGLAGTRPLDLRRAPTQSVL
jgi:hypothetical protein